jgi:phosphomevalonate decarboxylase
MKSTAVAHPIQGLIKYHGLKDEVKRIPYHDSISVCAAGLQTVTTVEFDQKLKTDSITINDKAVTGRDKERAKTVLDTLRQLAHSQLHARVVSKNSIVQGKGIGFSASGFAALGLAASKALGLELDYITLSEAVRLGAGSATRSLAGGFAQWYADKNGKSYAEQIANPKHLDFKMVIVPIPSELKTEEAHKEAVTSPLFEARLKYVNAMVEEMKKAIRNKDIAFIGRLAEEDTLNLHAITMTSRSRLLYWEPETLLVIKEVIRLRKEGVQAWFSIDTGPSVFINTYPEHIDQIASRMQELGFSNVVVSEVGDKARIIISSSFSLF